MSAVQQLSATSPGLIAQAPPTVDLDQLPPTAKKALDDSRGWSAPLGGLSFRFKGLNAQGQRTYEVKGSSTKKPVLVRADSADQALKQARTSFPAQGSDAQVPAQRRPGGSNAAPSVKSPSTDGSNWSNTRTTAGVADIKLDRPSFGMSQAQSQALSQAQSPSKPQVTKPRVTKPQVTNPPATTSPVATPTGLPSSAKAATGPLETKLRTQMETMAKAGGARSVKELVTVPELSPLYNDKSAALWATMNRSAYTSSAGAYGINDKGQAGSKGSLVNLYGSDNLVARTKQFDAAGVGAYSLLGACAGWNLNGIGGMTMPQRILQVPLGFVRDVANVGASKVDTSGVGNVWLEAGIKGGVGAVLTVGTNAIAGGAGKVFAPGQKSWAPDAPMRKGMVKASFTVNVSLTALNEMEKLGWLGGKLPSKPTGLQKLGDDIKQGAAIGAGVWIALKGPIKAAGGGKVATAMAFGLPFVQRVMGGKVTSGWSDPPVALGAAGNLVGDGGSLKVKALNQTDALRNGANPFQLADTNRGPNGKYQKIDEPAVKIATAILEIQDATRPTTATPNVRTNEEAAGVIDRALLLGRAGMLSEASKTQLVSLLSDLKSSGVYFGSAEAKAAANLPTAANGTATPAANAKQSAYVRSVFDGSLRAGDIKKTDWGSTIFDLGMTAGAFLAPKVFLPAGVFSEILKPTAVANGELNKTTFPGFAARINAKYGNVFAATGLSKPSGAATSPQYQAAELQAMKSLYASVQGVIRSRAGSATQHGTSNAPPYHGANGGYYFTAFERMTTAQKTAVRSEVNKDVQKLNAPASGATPVGK
jgi:hypothetical protein